MDESAALLPRYDVQRQCLQHMDESDIPPPPHRLFWTSLLLVWSLGSIATIAELHRQTSSSETIHNHLTLL